MFSVPVLKKVEDVMDKNYLAVYEDLFVIEAIKIMTKRGCTNVVVVDYDDNIKGVMSMKDVGKVDDLFGGDINVKVSDIMSENVISIAPGVTLDDCRNLMIQKGVGFLPVIDDGKIIGVIKQTHIRDFYYMKLEDYAITLEYIIGEIEEGISAMNEDGIVILWNKFMEKRYKIKSEDMVGKKMNNVLPNTISEKAMKKRETVSDVYYVYDEEKKENMYGLVNANPIYFNNDFVGVVCTEVDVTEARNLSNELEKTNAKIKYLEDEVKNLSKGVFDNILGTSYKIQKSKEIAKQVATTNASIFIWGESGTGKEVFARAIHEHSQRKGQFVPINCSAIPSELFESEFFGYEAGAFTGAKKNGKPGIFEIAKGGTIFLDEIADMPLSMQAKLLRVLQEREVRRVGGDKIINVDVRIISATNKDLEEMVKEEKFREDLYYRLNVVEIKIPPLRERKEDIGVLTYSFLESICKENNKPVLKLSKEAYKILESYNWKGNVRELKNAIEHIVVLSTSDTITKDDLPAYILENVYESNGFEEYPLDINEAIKRLEVKNIKKAMEMSGGNKAKAAKILNIPRTTLYYKLDNYKIK